MRRAVAITIGAGMIAAGTALAACGAAEPGEAAGDSLPSVTSAAPADLSDGLITCADGATVALDEILWVTQAGAAPWLRETGLEVDESGFVCVDDTLQSTSHPGVFAAGDVAAVVNHPRDKAGVARRIRANADIAR